MLYSELKVEVQISVLVLVGVHLFGVFNDNIDLNIIRLPSYDDLVIWLCETIIVYLRLFSCHFFVILLNAGLAN